MAALPHSTPSSQRVDAAGVAAFVHALEAAPTITPHSVMLLRHGHVVAEGWWAPYTRERRQLLYSLSKSFASTAVGLAAAEGLLSLDEPVLSYFPELAGEVSDERTRRTTVRHLLSMASGHREDMLDAARAKDPYDLVRGFLLLPPVDEPGTVFAYNQPCTYTVAAVVARVSGRTLTEFLRPRVLDPIGVGDVGWTSDESGRELAWSGLHATTDAVARLGLLYLQRGLWEGRRVLPEAWVDEATRRHVGTPEMDNPDWQQGYGFQFWQARHGYRGDGAYGQFCVVLPEQDAVLAVTSETEDMQGVLDAAWTHLLPAFDRAGEAGADDRLAGRLAALAIPDLAPTSAGSDVWNGFHASVDGLVGGVALAHGGDGWRLTLSDRASVPDPLAVVAALDHEGWRVSDDGQVPVAATAAWPSPTVFTAEVVFLETPHSLHVACDLGERTATLAWGSRPLSARRLGDLAAPK